MSKYTPVFLLFLTTIVGCAKQKAATTSIMTVNIIGDSTWTANEVTATIILGNAYVTGTNTATGQVMSLILYGYRDGNKAYAVHDEASMGSVVTGGTAEYHYPSYVQDASTGSVEIVDSAGRMMTGNFDVQNTEIHITVRFTVPMP